MQDGTEIISSKSCLITCDGAIALLIVEAIAGTPHIRAAHGKQFADPNTLLGPHN